MTVENRTAKHNLHNKAHLAYIFFPTRQFSCFGQHILMGIKTRLDKMSKHVKINCENHKNHKKKKRAYKYWNTQKEDLEMA